ncbi:carbohydrate porin [Alkalinema sp. FACHB-956]|nr:carbohydrate porin [Alkalinema sp. FACHB-956]
MSGLGVSVSAVAQTTQPESQTAHPITQNPVPTDFSSNTHSIFEQIEALGTETATPIAGMEQVTATAQLTDVQPQDWAFQALQSLVERYGCIAGYPDRTFRGNQALTRYEFAAGLNACMDRVSELVNAATDSLAQKEDLVTLQKLQETFAAELATLRGRVDGLESRTATLEKQQFSTTTKLMGITIVGFQGTSENTARRGGQATRDTSTNVNLINWNYLILNTAFSPTSVLTTSLLNINGNGGPKGSFVRSINDDRVGYDFFDVPGLQLFDLNYRFLVGNKLAGFVGTEGIYTYAAFRGPNRVESAATGPISLFAQRNPILNLGLGRGGAGFDWQFAKRASLQGVYHTNIPGVFPSASGPKGHNTFGFQLALTPIDPLDINIYYVNNYAPDGIPLGFVGDDILTAPNLTTGNFPPLSTHAIGTSVNWQVSPKLSVGGWFGYTNSHIPGQSGNVETTNYMAYLNFPDLFGKGNLGGIYVGQPPKIVSSNLPIGSNYPDFLTTGAGRAGGQPGTSTHVEVFYRWQVNDRISITPGFFVVFQPGHSPDSDPIAVGALRTAFTW